MKTILAFVLCSIFSMPVNCQTLLTPAKAYKNEPIYINATNTEVRNRLDKEDSLNHTSPCEGNGVVTFINSSSKPLWFYYWYVEDVANPSNECRFRRFWKQLDAGNNLFTIPKDKTLIFRIYTSTECANNFIKQFGIEHYCNTKDEIIRVN